MLAISVFPKDPTAQYAHCEISGSWVCFIALMLTWDCNNANFNCGGPWMVLTANGITFVKVNR